jgi:hypothetical protein
VVVEVGATQDDASEATQIVRLDDDLEPGTKVDFIKIDVEGHDLHSLRGMSRALPQRPIIDLKQHNFIFTDGAGHAERDSRAPKPAGVLVGVAGRDL